MARVVWEFYEVFCVKISLNAFYLVLGYGCEASLIYILLTAYASRIVNFLFNTIAWNLICWD